MEDDRAVKEAQVVRESPLQEVEAESLDELFSRDPGGYGQKDLEAAVAAFRRMRAKWDVEEKEGGKKEGGKKAQKAPRAPKETLTLDDLLKD